MKAKLGAIFLLCLYCRCSGILSDDQTTVQVEIQKVPNGSPIDITARYLAEIEVAQAIGGVYPFLRNKCQARSVMVYFDNYHESDDVSFASVVVTPYGSELLFEFYVKDMTLIRRYTQAMMAIDVSRREPTPVQGRSFYWARVTLGQHLPLERLAYSLKQLDAGTRYTRLQYICRNISGKRIKQLEGKWIRYQREFVK
ncbi:MAG: hypothetical protein ACOZBH_01430 [Patescibacteria group bacterium]